MAGLLVRPAIFVLADLADFADLSECYIRNSLF